MNKVGDFNRYGEELEKRVLLRTSPIAIKMLESENDIPDGVLRPKTDLGLHMGLCQAFAKSRREKIAVAMLKEDNWCFLPVIGLGLAEAPDFFLEGHTNYPEMVADLEAAKNLAHSFPRLGYGKYIGIVSAPLSTADFEPDLVVIYCNSAQLRYLLGGMKYRTGYVLTSRLDPSGACVHCTVPVLKSGECLLTVPCGGDRAIAFAQDDELILSLPMDKLEDLIIGLRHFDEIGSGYNQFAPVMMLDSPLPQLYVKVGKMLGMDVHE